LKTRNFQTNSRITGPWSTRAEGWEADGGTGYWPDVEGGVPGRGGDQRRVVMGTLAPVTEEKKGIMESTTEVRPGEDF